MSTMSIRDFSFPRPETRFFKAGRLVYKFRIRARSRYSNEEEMSVGLLIQQELEDIIKVTLENLEDLLPFSSIHFDVFPHKKQWKEAPTLTFTHGGDTVPAYPYVVSVLLESNTHSGYQTDFTPFMARLCQEPKPKRSKTDTPLEDSILQKLLAAEARVPCQVIRCHVTSASRAVTNPPPEELRESGEPIDKGASQEGSRVDSQDPPAPSQVHSGGAEGRGDESGGRGSRPDAGSTGADPKGKPYFPLRCVLQ
ncbi:membrane-anchored junction protein [Gadus chalcogrammus]|uniref:membrane-anchored junction protein n=1 Tax=Gadus chalcogrammus TaxID=1042646 RepID=UPI0024C4CBB2|nr:membrane-anchored junction protein [Gadus chalcogrammus]XP_056431859.1 membrane-anchored junction protein [Gadus chalcogrammus]